MRLAFCFDTSVLCCVRVLRRRIPRCPSGLWRRHAHGFGYAVLFLRTVRLGFSFASIKDVDARRKNFIESVMCLRQKHFSFPERRVREHTRNVLNSCTRGARERLQFVVGGKVVCKDVFVWAHGFSESTFNRVHADFQKEYRKAYPKVSRLRSILLFPRCFQFVTKVGCVRT